MLKKIIKKFLPRSFLSTYHFFLAKLANWFFLFPSNKIVVIGVTGTNGKTTTANLISQLFECLGYKTGLTSTVNFKIGYQERLNDKKMTMLGRFQTQKILYQAARAGCQYAIIETSSQGIEQWRHSGINYDVVVFTNLTPEHIEAHGSFENYRAQKEKLFEHLAKSRRKKIRGKVVPKIIIANADDEEIFRLKKYHSDKFISYGFVNKADYQGSDLRTAGGLASFKFAGQEINTQLLGEFNAYNVLASLAVINALGLPADQVSACRVGGVPGRQEMINQGQNFKVMIDYAPEPASLEKLYQALGSLPRRKLIHILGSTGGGRDQARQPFLGRLAGQNADVVIVTNEDPYDDDPQTIIDRVAKGAEQAGKKINQNLFKILDRREAIAKAISLAQKDDLVLITGKGAEQAICVANGKKIPWDDRRVTRELIKEKTRNDSTKVKTE